MRALSYRPPYTLSGFTGHPDTLQAMVEAVQGRRGEQSMLVRSQLEEIVRDVREKDYLGEILAARFWVTENVRYMNDQLHVEMVKDPERLIEEYLATGRAVGDCDDIAALLACLGLCLGRHAEFVVVGFDGPNSYSHVFTRIKEPRSGKWIIVDPVAGTDERGMAERQTAHYFVSLDEPPEEAIRGYQLAGGF